MNLHKMYTLNKVRIASAHACSSGDNTYQGTYIFASVNTNNPFGCIDSFAGTHSQGEAQMRCGYPQFNLVDGSYQGYGRSFLCWLLQGKGAAQHHVVFVVLQFLSLQCQQGRMQAGVVKAAACSMHVGQRNHSLRVSSRTSRTLIS